MQNKTFDISDGNIYIKISENGELCSLKRDGAIDFIQANRLWDLCLENSECQEIEVYPTEKPDITLNKNSFVLKYTRVCSDKAAVYNIAVEITGIVENSRLTLGIKITNNEPGCIIRECRFPKIKLSETAENFAWRNSQRAGTTYPKIALWKDKKLSDHPGYQGLDELFKREILHYPGKMATTNSFIIDGTDNGLYFGSHDKSFQITLHTAQANVADKTVEMMMVKLPFLTEGKTFECGNFILAPYTGSWHKGADIYREFLLKNIELPQGHDKTKFFTGWERIIMRTQYGENLFTYDDLPKIAEELKECGIDAIFIFGWHAGGHDNDYPNYCVSESLGGYDKFKNAISKIKELGIQVNLYSNGQLIDRTSEFYRSGAGQRCSIHDIRGNEELQRWGFSGKGIYNSYFGGRTFSRTCPCAEEMTQKLLEFIDLAADLGADGVFFDQLGSGDPICFNPHHGHEVPFTRIMAARRDMLKNLRNYAHSKGLTIGIEHASDITAGCVDYIHSMPGGAAVNGKIIDGIKPFIPTDFDYFHYIFPEAKISNREIRDDNDIERRVNRMLLFDLQCDVEIKRCRDVIGTTPHYKEYLTKALAFKKRNRRYLEGALFRSNAYVWDINKETDVASYQLPNSTTTVIATQSHLEQAELEFNLDISKHIDHMDIIGEVKNISENKYLLKKDSVLLLHLTKDLTKQK